MYDLFFGQSTALFSIPAIVGTVFFALRMGLLLIGGDDAMDGGDAGDLGDMGDLDVDVSPESEPMDDGGTDHAFKVISIQSIGAFLMGAGWAGLGAYRGSGLDMTWSIGIAVLGGIAMVWLFLWLMKMVYDLQSSGNVSIRQAIGLDAEVYARVPGDRSGAGQVRVVIDDRMRMYSAITDGDTLDRGTQVRITKLNADNTVTVARV